MRLETKSATSTSCYNKTWMQDTAATTVSHHDRIKVPNCTSIVLAILVTYANIQY